MPFVRRDPQGKIINASVRQIMGAEFLPHGHPDLVAFLSSNGQDPQKVEETLAELRKSDMDMARAVEDLMMALLKRNVLKMTDLPPQVQDRMSLRTKLRLFVQDIYEQASDKNNILRP